MKIGTNIASSESIDQLNLEELKTVVYVRQLDVRDKNHEEYELGMWGVFDASSTMLGCGELKTDMLATATKKGCRPHVVH